MFPPAVSSHSPNPDKYNLKRVILYLSTSKSLDICQATMSRFSRYLEATLPTGNCTEKIGLFFTSFGEGSGPSSVASVYWTYTASVQGYNDGTLSYTGPLVYTVGYTDGTGATLGPLQCTVYTAVYIQCIYRLTLALGMGAPF